MCDEDTVKDNAAYLKQTSVNQTSELSTPITRRRFAGLTTAVAGLTACASPSITSPSIASPSNSSASPLIETDVTVTTPDGEADCFFVHPTEGKHPAVIVWPDVLGLRPAYRLMGARLATAGYAVLVVNPYYRQAKSPVVEPGASFQDPAVREHVIGFARTLSPTTNVTDAKAFVAYLDAQDSVDKNRKIGTTGYCMGGSMTMRTAAALPDRIGAGASFHGGRLVTDAPDSPHLLIDSMQARFLFAIAQNDDERDPAVKGVLQKTFDNAGLQAEVEVYEGALHGWCALDSQVYNEPQAEKAWERLTTIFGEALS